MAKVFRANRSAVVLLYLLLGAFASILACCATKREYGLPIALGTTSDDVRRILRTPPTQRYGAPQVGNDGNVTLSQTGDEITEWFYPVGIVAFFDHDRLAEVTLHTYTGYKGFVPYNGEIVRGITLSDGKEAILKRLGTPTKVENEEPASGTDRDIPVVWPAESTYYWRFNEYGVAATFLNQAQSVDEHLTFPRDRLVSVLLENAALFDKDLSRPSKANDYLFVWSRPMQFPINLPITQSATCRFKKSVGVGFQKPDPKSRRPEGIHYSINDEEESDTVTFINLDTHSPTVRSNGGQAALQVLSSDKELIALVHTSADGSIAEMYTIFRTEGVVLHSEQQGAPLIGPFGVIEMGYCN